MATTDAKLAKGLEPKVLERWKKYLAKPEEFHPFLEKWFGGDEVTTVAVPGVLRYLDKTGRPHIPSRSCCPGH